MRVVANPHNAGFSRACNQGARETSAPLLLFLNPDATLEPGDARDTRRPRSRRARVSGSWAPAPAAPTATSRFRPGPTSRSRPSGRQRRLVRGVLRRDPGALAEAEARHAVEAEPDWVSGACLLARREAFLAVGGFDEAFFLYEEDADLCRRVRAAGWQVVFTPAAEVRHSKGLSMARTPERARLEYHRSHLRYYQKHCGLAQRAALRLLLAGRAVLELVQAAVSGDLARGREAAALAAPGARRPLGYLTASSVSSASTTSPVCGSTADASVSVSPSRR